MGQGEKWVKDIKMGVKGETLDPHLVVYRGWSFPSLASSPLRGCSLARARVALRRRGLGFHPKPHKGFHPLTHF